jgi:hypothetical protein
VTTGYLQHTRDWTITKEAIVRLSTRLGHPFTYADLATEIEDRDGLKIDPRGYAGALDAVAARLRSDEPMWTVMVVNGETGEPGDSFWQADYPDTQYRIVATLSDGARRLWLEAQQRWCVAAAGVAAEPLERTVRDEEARAREHARESLVDLMLRDRRGEA